MMDGMDASTYGQWHLAQVTTSTTSEPHDGDVYLAGESLPARVTASMWIESKGPNPEAALCGLRRQVEHWQKAEGWELADGAVSIDHWPEDPDYQASVRLVRTVAW